MEVTFEKRYAPFPAERLEAVSRVLTDTTSSSTGPEPIRLPRSTGFPGRTLTHSFSLCSL